MSDVYSAKNSGGGKRTGGGGRATTNRQMDQIVHLLPKKVSPKRALDVAKMEKQ